MKNKLNVENTKKTKPLLNVENLNMTFKVRGNNFHALKNVSFTVNEGDFFGIIGESGSGKSTTGKCIIKLYQSTGGKIEIDNHLISNKKLSRKSKKWLRKNVQMIFQDPMASLNPTKNVLQLISEPLVINKTIYNSAFSQWWKINNVAKYFLLDFIDWYDNKFFSFKEKYLLSLNSKLKNAINDFSLVLDKDHSGKTTREKLIFKMDTLVEKVQENSAIISEFSKEFDDVIKNLKSEYDSENYNVIFKNYEHLHKDFKSKKLINEISNEANNIKTEMLNNQKDLKKFVDKFKEEYKVQNYGYIKSWETTVKSKIRNFEKDKNYSKNEIDFTLNYIDYIIQKFLLIFVKKLKKYRYLDEGEIVSVTTYSLDMITNLFNGINEKVIKLSSLFDLASIDKKNIIIENMIAIKKIAESIYINFKNNQWSNYDYVLNSYKVIMSQHPRFYELDNEINCSIFKIDKFDDFYNEQCKYYKELIKLEKFFIDVSNERIKKYKEELKEKRSILIEQKADFIVAKKYYKTNQEERDINNALYQKSYAKFCDAENKREKYLKESYYAFQNSAERRTNLITKKNNIRSLKTENKMLIKKLKIKIHSIIYNIKKENKANIEGNLFKKLFDNYSFVKTLKKEIKMRFKTIGALQFEFNNIVREINVYSILFEQYRWFNWVLLPLLIQLLKRDAVYNALDSVGLKREHAYRYPHEFSGGQRQRIVIARALINNPKIIIADEPISALDVSIQAQIINILQDLCKKQNVTILFIAHDLSMVNYACENVIIMHRGRILEKGKVDKIFANPIHPYTRSLMRATPKLSRIHVDLAAFNENFAYDKEWTIFDKPQFYEIDGKEHQVFGNRKQIDQWIIESKKEKIL